MAFSYFRDSAGKIQHIFMGDQRRLRQDRDRFWLELCLRWSLFRLRKIRIQKRQDLLGSNQRRNRVQKEHQRAPVMRRTLGAPSERLRELPHCRASEVGRYSLLWRDKYPVRQSRKLIILHWNNQPESVQGLLPWIGLLQAWRNQGGTHHIAICWSRIHHCLCRSWFRQSLRFFRWLLRDTL